MALLAGLLGSGPAFATDPAPAWVPVESTARAKALGWWQEGGSAVREAAEVALLGDATAVDTFLNSGRALAALRDERADAEQILALGGPQVREAAQRALSSDSGTGEVIRAFLATGWKWPLEQDQRIRVAQAMNGAGRGVQDAGKAALSGTPDDVQRFLTEGQYSNRDADDRVRLVQILSAGGPNTKTAAKIAINGSIEEVREFLKTGQYVARARDEERASIVQLAQQAREASALAVRETAEAKEASAKAVVAAELARQAAQRAEEETRAAQTDKLKAQAALDRAALAAAQAGEAAQLATVAAQAANKTARAAANAASQAAYAASGAAQAAAQARNAAAAAASDADKAKAAKDAADTAKLAAQTAFDSTEAAADSRLASAASEQAASDALNAGGNALAAAAAADRAGDYAGVSGAQAGKAKQAAAATRRHADAATAAATAARDLAKAASLAAGEAEVLAASAETHARNAEVAAREAELHAGEAATAAANSTAHAQAAQAAAATATEAVVKAGEIHKLAVRAEQEELVARTAAALALASESRLADEAAKAEAGLAVQELRALKDEADRLATALDQPDANTAQIVTDGRKLALLSMKISGPWGKGAARTALSGRDDTSTAVLDYVKTGRRQAAELDDRARVQSLAADSEMASVRAAATEALKGDAAQITAFLASGQHHAAFMDYRVGVATVMNGSGNEVQKAGRAALDGNLDAVRKFLTTDRYIAQAIDDRVRVATIANYGAESAERNETSVAGEEVKAAAKIALEGAPKLLRAFLDNGQYTAQRLDQLTLAHNADIDSLIASADAVAAYARKSAAEASQAAALANDKAAEAADYANQAQTAATQAAGFADDARNAATEAANKATQAAEAAKTAAAAQASARRAAASAIYSAKKAQGSATQAQWSAAGAYASAAAARASAEAAGKDAETAAQSAKQAFDSYTHMHDVEQEAARAAAEKARLDAQQAQQDAQAKEAVLAELDAQIKQKQKEKDEASVWYTVVSEGVHLTLDIVGGVGGVFLPGLADIADLINCAIYALEGDAQNATLSCVAAIPFAGDAAALVKFVKWTEKFGTWGKQAYEYIQKMFSKVPTACTRNSFPEGTRVLMGDGTTTPIEKLEIGDQVLASNPQTGETGPRNVEATIYTPDDRDFTDLTIKTVNGETATLTATDHHPFWSQSRQEWTDAADLRTGDTLRTPTAQDVTVAHVQYRKTLQAAYNLTVSDLHTYYVLAGTAPVLVHNTQGCGPDLGDNWTPRAKSEINGVADCDQCALDIQKALGGGDVYQIAGRFPGARPYVYRGVSTSWPQHFVVIKDGKVFDAWTGRSGEPIEDYMKNFADPSIPGDDANEILKLTQGTFTPNPDSGGGLTWKPKL